MNEPWQFRKISKLKEKDLNLLKTVDKNMATTIVVTETTKNLLEAIKKGGDISSYDKVIQHLAEDHKKEHSLFGAAKGLKWNKQKDRMKFDEL